MVQTMRLTIAAVLALGLAACDQGNADNVMAPNANALDANDVNAALGPELVNTDANLFGAENATVPANTTDATGAANARPPADAAESAPEEAPAADEAADSNSAENSQ